MKNTKTDMGLDRFREINKYAKTFITEQATPPVEDPNALPPTEDPNAMAAEDPNALPAEDPNALPPIDDTGAGLPGDGEVTPDTTEDDTTEEIDITDLVNMVKDVKKQMDNTQDENPAEIQKMDDIFSKLGELEGKLGEMDSVLAKIDQLGAQIQDSKPPTPVEKLEMRSLDSYPFNQKPDEFFHDKKEEMKKSGKNEYILTKGDVENYGKYDMMKSFNPAVDDNY